MIAQVLVRGDTVVTGSGDTTDVPWWSFTKTVLAAAALALVRDRRLAIRPITIRAWVYHGLLVGPSRQAALLLQRLMVGDLLPPPLLSAMGDRYPLGGPIADRPWKTPSYGLGLMIGETTGGALVAGHTGGGPGSAVAVYHRLDRPTGTAATFKAACDDASVESACVALLGTGP